MKYEAIIYDLDGTLVDSRKDIANTTNATIVKHGGIPLPDKQIFEYVGGGVRDLVAQAAPHFDEETILEALKFFDVHYLDHCLDETCLYPGAAELIAELSKMKIAQAIFTNKPQHFTDKIMAGLEIEHHFHVSLGANNGYPNKPERDGTDFILGKLGSQPEKTLMVGDSIVDLKTAQNVGMDCVLMLDGYTTREVLYSVKHQAVRLCETFAELRAFLLG